MTTRSRRASGLRAPDPTELLARSTLVDPSEWTHARVAAAADEGQLAAGRSRTYAAFGTAAVLALPDGLCDTEALGEATRWLAAVEHRHEDGVGDGAEAEAGADAEAGVGGGTGTGAPGVVALGAFPFDRSAPGALVVPSVVWCRDLDGRTWRIEVGARGASRRADPESTGAAPSKNLGRAALGSPRLAQRPAPEGYAAAVCDAVADIAAGKLEKVVLGRAVDVHLPVPAVPSRILDVLWGGDPVFAPFSVPTPEGRLVGASPELVVSRLGTRVVSHAFGGTVALSGIQDELAVERLFASEKERAEHRLVVQEIAEALGSRLMGLSVPADPSVVRWRSDARLGTLICGTLAPDAARAGGGGTSLALLSLLHPTPAVGGVPRSVALERIAALEEEPRGYWAGVVGWTDATGDGEWILALRSAVLDASRARVHAGAGIVAGSEPYGELAETTFKLRPVLDALWPGASSLL